ncbi:MAG: DUF2878 domain-containing protein [Gammaproteobacteria bacterium]|nr:DUF2878 domain-containing protein [Gammaproteobacteria bacterium]
MRPSLIMGISVIVFQIQWWLCIFSGIYQHAQYAYGVAFALFLINLLYQPITRPMLLFFLILFSCGVANDTLLMQLKVLGFSFQGALIPVWLMILWACFSAWFLHAQWLNQRLIVILCLFSICGTGSYYCAARLHALTFLMPLNYSLMIMALDWFCLGVLFFIIVRCRCIKRFLG